MLQAANESLKYSKGENRQIDREMDELGDRQIDRQTDRQRQMSMEHLIFLHVSVPSS